LPQGLWVPACAGMTKGKFSSFQAPPTRHDGLRGNDELQMAEQLLGSQVIVLSALLAVNGPAAGAAEAELLVDAQRSRVVLHRLDLDRLDSLPLKLAEDLA